MTATQGNWTTQNINNMQYMVLLPDGYDPSVKYPTTLYLHALDNGSPGLEFLQTQIDPYFDTAQFRTDHPSIIVAPVLDQTADTSGETINWGGVSTADTDGETNAIAALQQVMSQYSVDPSRVYVTGNSMGGIGAEDMLTKFNAYTGTEGKIFTAGLALAGADYGQDPTTMASVLQDVPYMAIHGAQDTQIPLTTDQTVYAAIHAAGGKMIYNEDPNLGHDVWDTYYTQTGQDSPLSWLYDQSTDGSSQAASSLVQNTSTASSDTSGVNMANTGTDVSNTGTVTSSTLPTDVSNTGTVTSSTLPTDVSNTGTVAANTSGTDVSNTGTVAANTSGTDVSNSGTVASDTSGTGTAASDASGTDASNTGAIASGTAVTDQSNVGAVASGRHGTHGHHGGTIASDTSGTTDPSATTTPATTPVSNDTSGTGTSGTDTTQPVTATTTPSTVSSDMLQLASHDVTGDVLGSTATSLQFGGASGASVTGLAGMSVISAVDGDNSFTVGSGLFDITGGTGADSYTFGGAKSTFLGIQDFSTAKGDTLNVPSSLQQSMQTVTAGNDTLLMFGSNGLIDLHGITAAPTIHWI